MSESINRAFMYGESVFSTMRMINGHLSDWDLHFDRLKKGVDFLYGPFSEGDEWDRRLSERLLEKTGSEIGNLVIRLSVYREQARGLISKGIVSVNDLKIHVATSPLDLSHSELQTYKLRTCTAVMRAPWWPDFFKAGNYLDTILAQKMFMQPGDDDILFLSPENSVLASSVANIFVVIGDLLYTAPSGPNVLAGIMRKKVIQVASTCFAGFKESEIPVEHLSKASAVFGSNSVRGIFLVDKIDDYHFQYSQDFLTGFEVLRKRVLL